jgi:D-alanine-D-alanine ligase
MKNLALIYGGFSGESAVSEKSAHEIFLRIDNTTYNPVKVKITDANWVAEYQGEALPIDKNDFSFTLKGQKIKFDKVFNIIHGTPGEDGKLSGYFDLLGIPYNSSGVLVSALTFNKNWCNRFLSTYGIVVPQSVVFYKNENNQEKITQLYYPCFVKPNNGGSSIGTHKVKNESELLKALEDAFKHDTEVIVEEFIAGREFSCGVIKTNEAVKVLPVTEIIPQSEFFDYTQKYSENGAKEITPADLSEEETKACQQIVAKVFGILRLKKVARIDFILKNNQFYLIEVNTIPGMSPKSILPQQAKHIGWAFEDLVAELIRTDEN